MNYFCWENVFFDKKNNEIIFSFATILNFSKQFQSKNDGIQYFIRPSLEIKPKRLTKIQ